MSAYSYFPTDEQLEERPHLRAHLLQIKELQEKYFSEHPDEDHDEIRLFEAGQCGGPLVAEFHDTIVKLDIRKKKRTRWNQFNSNKREENLSFRNPEHQSLIKAQYQELKADEQMLQLLDQQTEQYNEKIESEAIQTRPLILKKQMKQLKKLCDWLHLNFKTHIALFYATDATELMQRVGCYYNSGVGKQFKSKLFSETGQYPELMLQNMVITEGMNIKRKMEVLMSEASLCAPDSSSTETEGVDLLLVTLESLKNLTQKKQYLQKYIRDKVFKLYQQQCSHKVNGIPWATLLDSDSKIKLQPWIRVENDLRDSRYRLQCLDLEILIELASNLQKGIVEIVKRD